MRGVITFAILRRVKFRDYYYGIPVKRREAFAKRVGVSAGYLKLVAQGERQVGESVAIEVEKASAGAVTVEELRPDVDWAYLRSSVKSA